MPGAQGCRVCVPRVCLSVFAAGSRGLPHACAPGCYRVGLPGLPGPAQTDTTRGAFLFTIVVGGEGGEADGEELRRRRIYTHEKKALLQHIHRRTAAMPSGLEQVR